MTQEKGTVLKNLNHLKINIAFFDVFPVPLRSMRFIINLIYSRSWTTDFANRLYLYRIYVLPTDCAASCLTSCIIYTDFQPIGQPVGNPAVSCIQTSNGWPTRCIVYA